MAEKVSNMKEKVGHLGTEMETGNGNAGNKGQRHKDEECLRQAHEHSYHRRERIHELLDGSRNHPNENKEGKQVGTRRTEQTKALE